MKLVECFDNQLNKVNLCIWDKDIKKYNNIIQHNNIIEIDTFYYNGDHNSINIISKSNITLINKFTFINDKDSTRIKIDELMNVKLNTKQKLITDYFN